MKYANNHPWKFRSPNSAYFVGFSQAFVVYAVEIINIMTLLTNNTVKDIIMNFLALMVLSDFDNFLFETPTFKNSFVGKFLDEGKFTWKPVSANGETEPDAEEVTIELEDTLKKEVTTSNDAKFQMRENRIDYDPAQSESEPDEDDPTAGNLAQNKENQSGDNVRPSFIYMSFRQRSWINKVCRLWYKLLRIIYVSFWFYYPAFFIILLSYFIPWNKDSEQPEEKAVVQALEDVGLAALKTLLP